MSAGLNNRVGEGGINEKVLALWAIDAGRFGGTLGLMDAPRFVADKTVGRLAKWLRLLGFDCAFLPNATPAQLVEQVETGNLILLTKNTHLPGLIQRGRSLWIGSDHGAEQLKQVITEYGLTIECDLFLSRCSICNVSLEDLPRDAARGRVPAYVFATRQTFRNCRQCGRIYWGGTHKSRMLDRLRETLDSGES